VVRPRCPTLAALAVLLGLAATVAVGAEAEDPRKVERRGDLVSVFSGDVHVPAHVHQLGSVICIGGTAIVEGRVSQDVVVILGSLELTGSVGGTVTGVLSDMRLEDARVGRELVSIAGDIELTNSTVSRQLVNIFGGFDRDAASRVAGQVIQVGDWAPSVWALLFWIRTFHKFLVFLLLALLALLVPERIRQMGREAPVRYVPAFFMGVLGYLAMLILVGLLSFTVVGIPVALLAFYVLKWAGIAAIFFAIGNRIGRAAGFTPSVLGAVFLVFSAYVVIMLVPAAFGWFGLVVTGTLKLVFFLLVELPAVGLVILTRFGGERTDPSAEPLPLSPSARPPVVSEPST
jgi:hypothetical protein